jgi:internalin A
LLAFYFDSREEKRALNEAKLILVGRGGAGKTSIRNRLLFDGFDEQETKTPGIQVAPWNVGVGDQNFRLNVWDFGGQEIMHATHQFFLTARSLYLLVINAREGEQDANLEYWLRLIGGYGGGSPSLVVVNKSDQHPLDVDQRGLREKFPFIRQFIRTDCKTRQGLTELRQAIETETAGLSHVRDLLPPKYFEIKQTLEQMPADCITYDEYRRECRKSTDMDGNAQDNLIRLLHDLGTVLHFRDDPRLNDLGVLKPEWVTQGIYGLLNAEAPRKAGGVLKVTQLKDILDQNKYPLERHDYLIRLMLRFELCFELPHTNGESFLVPELLPKEMPPCQNGRMSTGFDSSIITIYCPKGCCPVLLCEPTS